jgi:hypothetical protein
MRDLLLVATFGLLGAGCRATAVTPPLANLPPPRPRAAFAGTTFGDDHAGDLDTMRLAHALAGEVWLGETPRPASVVDPIELATTFDSARGAIGAAEVVAGLPLGDPRRQLDGLEVTVLDDNLAVACAGALRDPHLVFAGFIEPVSRDEAMAAATRTLTPWLVATVSAPCTGPFVRGVRGTTIAAAPARTDAIPDSELADLRAWTGPTQSGVIEQLVVGDAGFALVEVDTPDACDTEENHHWTLYRAGRYEGTWLLDQVAQGDADDHLERVVDVDGDGKLDAFTTRGAYVGERWQTRSPDLRIFMPPGLGCDGYDPATDSAAAGPPEP